MTRAFIQSQWVISFCRKLTTCYTIYTTIGHYHKHYCHKCFDSLLGSRILTVFSPTFESFVSTKSWFSWILWFLLSFVSGFSIFRIRMEDNCCKLVPWCRLLLLLRNGFVSSEDASNSAKTQWILTWILTNIAQLFVNVLQLIYNWFPPLVKLSLAP